MGEARKVKGNDALKLILQGDILTDGEFFYGPGTIRRKDGTEINVIQTYKNIIWKTDPIAITLSDKWLDAIGDKELHTAYLTADEAKDAMMNGHAVMDSNGVVHFQQAIVNPVDPSGVWVCIVSLNEDGFPEIDCDWMEFDQIYNDDDAFIIHYFDPEEDE